MIPLASKQKVFNLSKKKGIFRRLVISRWPNSFPWRSIHESIRRFQRCRRHQ